MPKTRSSPRHGQTGDDVDRKAVFLYELASAVENDKPIVHKNMRFIAGPPVFVGQVLYEAFVLELDRREPRVIGDILQCISIRAFIWRGGPDDGLR